jgi:hypothetical protein
MTPYNLNSAYNEKSSFHRAYRGDLSTWEYVHYLGILEKKRMILKLGDENINFGQFPREHPTKEHYSGLVEIAKKAGLR